MQHGGLSVPPSELSTHNITKHLSAPVGPPKRDAPSEAVAAKEAEAAAAAPAEPAAMAAATAPPEVPPSAPARGASGKTMTDEQALAAAAAEGLSLVTSSAASGYWQVFCDHRLFRAPRVGERPNIQGKSAAGVALDLARWRADHPEGSVRGEGGGGGGGGDRGGGGRLGIGSAGKRAQSGARVAEALLASNGELGAARRYLTQWHGQPRGDATWEAASKLPTALLEDFEREQQLVHNVSMYAALEPSAPRLGDPGTTGVMPCEAAAEADASACASYLREHWSTDGVLPLPNGSKCYGYASYGKTLARHDADVQAKTTLLLTHALLPAVRAHVAGFGAMEAALAAWLHARFGRCVTLHYAHALRQAPTTLSATGFDVHQDTEDYPEIEFTVVVKLSEDMDGEAPSRMRVVGAAEPFTYGARAGAAGCFLAGMYHASMPPESELEHLKIAFFFRVSERGERRAIRLALPLALPAAPNEASEAERWRLLQPQPQPLGRSRRSERRGAQHDAKQPPLHNHELMLMRQKVMHELNATNLNLAASGDRAVLGLVNTRAR
jgi:hypothetical protein